MSDQLALALRQAIRAERARLGISQADLAERLGPGWSRQIVAGIETGVRKVYAHELPDLCIALETDLGTLVVKASQRDRAALGL